LLQDILISKEVINRNSLIGLLLTLMLNIFLSKKIIEMDGK
jgi:hypothetical protein